MRRFARLVRVVVALVLALGPGLSAPAFAHTRSETHSAWQIKGATVHLQFTVPDLEAKRITPDGDMPSVEQLGNYVAGHVGALSGDQACKMTEGPRPLATAPGYRRYEFTLECPEAESIKVHPGLEIDDLDRPVVERRHEQPLARNIDADVIDTAVDLRHR